MGVRSTASSQFHEINNLLLLNGNESNLREVMEKNKLTLEAQLKRKLKL